MLGNIAAVLDTYITVNHSFGEVSDTAKTQNVVLAAVSVTAETEQCALTGSRVNPTLNATV